MFARTLSAIVIASSLSLSPVLLQAASAATEQADKKPKRERSQAQKKNDQIMRDCGAEWRSKKDEMAKKGTKWRDYLKECRAKKKA